MSVPVEWIHWDPDSFGQQFQGKELTVWSGIPQKGPSTTYRNDYPVPPLHWAHQPAPDRNNRPTPAFGHTTSHRADFKAHPVGGGAAILRPYPEAKFQPKLSAVTTGRHDFKIPPLPPPRPPDNKNVYKPSDAQLGTTTMRADYREWTMPGARPAKEVIEPKPTKFHAITTTRNDFPWPKEMAPPPMPEERAPHVVPKFAGTTEYRAAFETVALPLGMKADIGIQVATKPYKQGGIGGTFDLFIKSTQAAPAQNKKTYTTAADNQNAATILVVAKAPGAEHGVVVGHFMMENIKPEKVGVNKVEVYLKLSSESTLQVAAHYRNQNRSKRLAFVANQAMRTVAQASDVPS